MRVYGTMKTLQLTSMGVRLCSASTQSVLVTVEITSPSNWLSVLQLNPFLANNESRIPEVLQLYSLLCSSLRKLTKPFPLPLVVLNVNDTRITWSARLACKFWDSHQDSVMQWVWNDIQELEFTDTQVKSAEMTADYTEKHSFHCHIFHTHKAKNVIIFSKNYNFFTYSEFLRLLFTIRKTQTINHPAFY